MSSEKIAKLESKVNDIMGRPTYSVTPAWQSEVAEIRVQIEGIRTGQEVDRKEYSRPTISAGSGGAAVAAMPTTAAAHDDDHHESPYIAIFVGLLIMTLLEWKCSAWFGISGVALWVVLTVMAVVKALWVALYFMHVKFERKTFHLLLVIPVFLIILMLALVSPDAQQHLMQYLPFLF